MKVFLSLFLFCCSFLAIGSTTPQQPDYLWHKGKKLTLSTGWGHPSPLETYFIQKEIESPFSMISTANYRGHVAVWKIEGNQLRLKEIIVREKSFHPRAFKVQSEEAAEIKKEGVFGDWFSGVIEAHGEKATFYFRVKRGKIIDQQRIIPDDFKRIDRFTAADTLDLDLMRKYELLYINQQYVSYYFRLHGKDTLKIDKQRGFFINKSGVSPLLSYYKNDHLLWPYNWENVQRSGAPICNWRLEKKKIYLTNVNLHSGTGFYEIEEDSVALTTLFPETEHEDKVFAHWLNGNYRIVFGEEIKDELNMSQFKPTKFTLIKVSEGNVITSYDLPGGFDFRNLPPDLDPRLKELLDH